MLQRVIINGFKSIKTMDLELRPLNILIGANGAGKSNLISFFKMLNEMMAGRLQQYIGISGYAQSLLHFGPKVTPQIEAQLEFEVENGMDTYTLRLFHAAGDTLIFGEETLSFLQNGWSSPRTDSLDGGHKETKINEGIMKELTGGDPVQGRALYCESEIFEPQFKLVVCTNSLFEINSNDDGTWRRIRICDFLSIFK